MIPQERENFHQAPEKFTKKQKLIAIMSGAAFALTIGGGLFINHVAGEKPPIVATAPANLDQTPQIASTNKMDVTDPTISTPREKNIVETTPTIDNLEIDASLLSNPEALAKTFIDERVTGWFNAGLTPENAQAALSSRHIDDYAATEAGKYDEMFIEALLVNNWESIPSLKEWVNNMKEIHKTTLALGYYTSFPKINPQDKEPYKRGTECVKFESSTRSTNGTTTIKTIEKDYDNSDNNRVGEKLTGGEKVAGESGSVTRTFVIENGKIKLSSAVLNNR